MHKTKNKFIKKEMNKVAYIPLKKWFFLIFYKMNKKYYYSIESEIDLYDNMIDIFPSSLDSKNRLIMYYYSKEQITEYIPKKNILLDHYFATATEG